jgi:glycosyltransferase involved in cell wall biosynthesis
MSKPFFSIPIPTYEMSGYGASFLEHNLNKLKSQTFQDFEVVVTDHSKNDVIQNLCKEWANKLNLKYYRNEYKRGSLSANLNFAMSKCQGEWVKVVFQDDFLFMDKALEVIVERIKTTTKPWLITACEHSNDGVTFYRQFFPRWNPDMFIGNNTFSCPSVLTVKKDCSIQFDEDLNWLMDVEYYQQMYSKYGEPEYINTVCVAIRTWEQSTTNSTSQELKNREYLLQAKRYNLIKP